MGLDPFRIAPIATHGCSCRWVTMTTLDDKLLGEKLQYYYSSSEDEDSDKEDEAVEDKSIRNTEVLEAEYTQDGSAINTGERFLCGFAVYYTAH